MKITLSELKQIIKQEVRRERVFLISEIGRIDVDMRIGIYDEDGFEQKKGRFITKIENMIKGRIRTGVKSDTEPPTVVLYNLPLNFQIKMLDEILTLSNKYKPQYVEKHKNTALFKVFISDVDFYKEDELKTLERRLAGNQLIIRHPRNEDERIKTQKEIESLNQRIPILKQTINDNKVENQIPHLIQVADSNNIEIFRIPKEDKFYVVGQYERNRWDRTGEMPGSSGWSSPKHTEYRKEKITKRQYSKQ